MSVANGVLAAPERRTTRRIYYLCFQVTQEGQASHAHVHEILAGLGRRGWQTRLFQPAPGGGRRRALWRRLVSALAPQWRLWRTTPRPDLLYYRSHPAALPSIVWARFHRIPVVGEVNGTFADIRLIYPWLLPLVPFIYLASLACMRASSALITVTGPLREYLRNIVPQTPVYVVPNAANTVLFQPNATADLKLTEPYVVFVGAMSPWQGIGTLIAAAERREWPPEVKLLFIGDGVERPLVEEAVKRNPAVLYWGRKPYRAIPGIIARSLAGLSTQNNRRGKNAQYGFSAMKVYETMACGVPVIVTDFPGQGDVVREARAGIVVEPENAAAIAQAVAYIYANPEASNEMGLRARAAAEGQHTWDHRAEAVESILLSTLPQENSPRV
jgi:glycosyltransferase involved in cell wall biosynthesis